MFYMCALQKNTIMFNYLSLFACASIIFLKSTMLWDIFNKVLANSAFFKISFTNNYFYFRPISIPF